MGIVKGTGKDHWSLITDLESVSQSVHLPRTHSFTHPSNPSRFPHISTYLGFSADSTSCSWATGTAGTRTRTRRPRRPFSRSLPPRPRCNLCWNSAPSCPGGFPLALASSATTKSSPNEHIHDHNWWYFRGQTPVLGGVRKTRGTTDGPVRDRDRAPPKGW